MCNCVNSSLPSAARCSLLVRSSAGCVVVVYVVVSVVQYTVLLFSPSLVRLLLCFCSFVCVCVCCCVVVCSDGLADGIDRCRRVGERTSQHLCTHGMRLITMAWWVTDRPSRWSCAAGVSNADGRTIDWCVCLCAYFCSPTVHTNAGETPRK
jgi:hypothetical protein